MLAREGRDAVTTRAVAAAAGVQAPAIYRLFGEKLAAALIHATARGAVLTWLSLPDDQRDHALLSAMRESMVSAVTNEKPAVQDAGPAEWLDRLASDG